MKYLPFLLKAFESQNVSGSAEQHTSDDVISQITSEHIKREREVIDTISQYIRTINTENRYLLEEFETRINDIFKAIKAK